MEALIELLKSDEVNARVTCGSSWLVWNNGEWRVYSKPYRARATMLLYWGDSLSDAVAALKKQEA
jgi:hypothetical protein